MSPDLNNELGTTRNGEETEPCSASSTSKEIFSQKRKRYERNAKHMAAVAMVAKSWAKVSSIITTTKAKEDPNKKCPASKKNQQSSEAKKKKAAPKKKNNKKRKQPVDSDDENSEDDDDDSEDSENPPSLLYPKHEWPDENDHPSAPGAGWQFLRDYINKQKRFKVEAKEEYKQWQATMGVKFKKFRDVQENEILLLKTQIDEQVCIAEKVEIEQNAEIGKLREEVERLKKLLAK